jgi:hypothetical protein
VKANGCATGGFIGHWQLGNQQNRWHRRNQQPEDTSVEAKVKRIDKAYRTNDAFAQRVHDLGFNIVRYWTQPGCFEDYTPGDGSTADLFAASLTSLDKRGIKVWMTAWGNLGEVTPDDATVINDPKSEKAWREAVTGRRMGAAHNIAYAWDPILRSHTAARSTIQTAALKLKASITVMMKFTHRQ